MNANASPVRGSKADLALQLQRAEADVAQSEAERARLRYIPFGLLVVPWVCWAIFDWKIAIYGAAGVLMFWGVGHYLNFFHLREAKRRRDDVQAAFERAA